ncbi:UvrD-helicase domain-containing protein, partial [Paenibacillus sp. TAF58]
IIDKNNKNKVARLKIDTVLLHLEDSISTIFIDEAQDMNDDLFYLFTLLAELKIRIYMVGDPKLICPLDGGGITLDNRYLLQMITILTEAKVRIAEIESRSQAY